MHFIAINDLNQNETDVFKVRFSRINLNKIISGYDNFFAKIFFIVLNIRTSKMRIKPVCIKI